MASESNRDAIAEACRRMNALGINQGTSGNISVRHHDGMLISPSSMPYDTMTPGQVVFVDRDGSAHGEMRPSSEWRFHRDILRARPDLHAVVHAHPTYATALAICRRPIPAIHYMVAAAGGASIPCAEYHTFGTERLSCNITTVLRDRDACLIANHGMVACGDSLPRALWLAVEVETLARQYVVALQVGEPTVLSDEEISRVLKKFRNYGYGKRAG